MELANLSVLLVWGAATALAVALVAFAVDLSRLSGAKVDARDAARTRDKVAPTPSRSRRTARTPARASPSR
jgi:hypothetical protein